MDYAITTHLLSRTFEIHENAPGFWGQVGTLFRRKKLIKTALQPTNLNIHRGEIVGLVGANGAGKTTLLKLLSGLIHPSSGSAAVLGYTPWERKDDYLRRISVVLGQKNQLWWDLPARESYQLLMSIYSLEKKATTEKVNRIAEVLQCAHVLDTPLRKLSLGERMKMELIGSLLHDPEILFLDEPTIGLDIVSQSTIREFIKSYSREKKPTIILTSHYMDDIATLATQLLLITSGGIVYNGTVADFTAKAKANDASHVDFEDVIRNFLARGL